MLAERNPYLKEMGIEEWVLRENRRSTPAAQPARADSPAERPAVPEPVAETPETAPVPSPETVPPPEFHLCFATYDDLTLVFPVPQDASSIPDAHRRFADDIARALGREVDPLISALKWPLVRAAGIDQSPAAAQTVVAQRLAGAGAIRLLFGEVANRFAGDEGGVLLDTMEGYFAAPATKGALWRAVRRLRRASR